MLPRKEAGHGRAGHRKSRHHSSPERVNTARADEEYCNIALQHVNAVEKLPASEAKFSFTDSSNLRRLQHKVYEFSQGPAADQSQIPLFQRPTSLGSSPKGEGFAFQTRQHREMNVRGVKQPPTQQGSLPLQSNQRSHSDGNASDRADGVPLEEEQSHFLLEPSNSVTTNSKDFATATGVDLTHTSTSATMQSIQPTKMTENRQSTQERICQGPSECEMNESQTHNSIQSGVDGSPLCHSKTRREEVQSQSPLDVMPLRSRGTERSQKHGQNVQHPLPLTSVPQLRSRPTLQPTAHPQQNLSSPAIEQMLISKKETREGPSQRTGPNISVITPKEAHNESPSTLDQPAVTHAELTNLGGTQLTGSECEQNVDGPTHGTLRSQLPHTPRASARWTVQKPARVCKVVPSPRLLLPRTAAGSQGVSEQSNVTATSDGLVAISRHTAPSAEDLFYLLMYRQRQHKTIETGMWARQKQLEMANARLTQQNQNYQRQLSISHRNQDQATAEAKLQKTAMEDFKIRFQKLKTFVNGLGNDYSALRQQADQMKISHQDLLQEKEDIYRNLQGCQTASAASERSMGSIISEMAKVRQSITPLQQSLLGARETLEGESRLLLQEQQKNKRLETYLLRVATTQNRCNSAIQDEQRVILNQLNHITTKVNAVEKATTTGPQPLQLSGLDKCVKMLMTVHDADQVTAVDLTKLMDTVSTLSQSLSSYQKGSHESFQAATDAQVNLSNQLVTQITDLLKPLHAAAVGEGQFAGLREDKIRLEEQLKSCENMMREVREGRTSANASESQLQKITDGIMNELKALRHQSIALHKTSPRVDERDMIGTWQMKYTNISRQLTGSEDRVGLREKELRHSEEQAKKLSEQVKAAHAERDIAVQALKEAEDRHSAQEGEIAELQQKLAEKESSLGILRLRAQSAEDRIGEEAEKTKELASLQIQLQAELEEVNSKMRSATQERAKADQQVQELTNTLKGLAEAQQEAKKMTHLVEEPQNEHTRVISLHQEIAPLEEMARQIPRLKQEISEKQKAIESLESRLEEAEAEAEAEAVSDRVEAMERDASKSAESNMNEVQVVKEESQRREIELAALKGRLAKIEEMSQRQTRPEQPSQDQVLAQGTLALPEYMITRDDSDLQAGLTPPVPSATPQQRREAGCSINFVNPQALPTRISETVRLQSKRNGNPSLGQSSITPKASHPVQITEPNFFRTQETTFVPESQPALGFQYEQSFGSVSSPLTEVDFIESLCEPYNESTYFGAEKAGRSSASFTNTAVNSKSNSQRGAPSSRPPSSSYGETMLLEVEEDLKDLERHHRNALQESSTQLSGAQSESTSTGGPPTRKTEGALGNGGPKSSCKTLKAKSKGDTSVLSKRPSPRRLRSESQTQRNKTLALQERGFSDQNIAASPQRGILQEKHLPNSAAKRRLEDDEMSITSPSQGGSKRLKRNVSALEVKTPSKRKGSAFLGQMTSATGTGRLSHPSMRTGGRKGSIIRTSAPAPSADQHASQKSKKSLKTERYSARFNQDAA